MNRLETPPGRSRSDVSVRDTGPRGRGVFAGRHFAPGETVLSARRATVAAERSIYTFQFGDDLHIEAHEPASLVNHACDANTGVRDNAFGAYDLVARRPIAAGEEITFDYETTEFGPMIMEACHCGGPTCRGTLRGFRYRADLIRTLYGEFIACYLKR